jgi:uncharacterized protein (TIGR00288 family)
MFERLRQTFSGDRVAMFVDGPNMIRSEFDIDLDQLRTTASEIGTVKIARVFLNQYASDKLIEAIVSQGFEADMGLAGGKEKESDVDVYMAVNAMDAIHSDSIDTIVLVTRDTDFLPVIQRAKENGKKTVIVAVESGFSTALKNAADRTIFLDSE